ncbi:hypothetical protein BHM03_00016374 [Ensete ventricosum]|nr:hypothetical protein BHM03_00016374 [Ensete ventricosum]
MLFHRYATASARSDGMLLLCGGRDSSGMVRFLLRRKALSDAYGLLMHTNGQWEWTLAPGVSPSPRYQHAAVSGPIRCVIMVFVGARLHVTGGALKGGRNIEGEGAIADMLLGDFLVAENSPLQSEISSSMYNPERVPAVNHSVNSDSQSADMGLYFIVSVDRKSIDMLTEASAAEAEAASAVWRAAKEASIESLSDDKESESQVNDEFSNAENSSDAAYSLEPDVRLHSRAVVVAKETVGSLGGLIRQLSLDQFENESRRVHPTNGEQTYSAKKFLNRQKSPQGLHKKASM